MSSGFIPFSRASLMLDVVAAAMVVVIPLLAWSIYRVKIRRDFDLHKKLQLGMGTTLFVSVVLFEVDMRVYGWRHLAEESVFYGGVLNAALCVHLVFAISTSFLWFYTIWTAMKHFGRKPRPSAFSPRHKRVAWCAAIGMLGTAVTGWVFYLLAFVA